VTRVELINERQSTNYKFDLDKFDRQGNSYNEPLHDVTKIKQSMFVYLQ